MLYQLSYWGLVTLRSKNKPYQPLGFHAACFGTIPALLPALLPPSRHATTAAALLWKDDDGADGGGQGTEATDNLQLSDVRTVYSVSWAAHAAADVAACAAGAGAGAGAGVRRSARVVHVNDDNRLRWTHIERYGPGRSRARAEIERGVIISTHP